IGHGGVGVGILHEREPFQIERETVWMEVQFLDPNRVALERPVHLGLGVPAQRLVDQKRDGVGDHQDDGQGHADEYPETTMASHTRSQSRQIRSPAARPIPSLHGSASLSLWLFESKRHAASVFCHRSRLVCCATILPARDGPPLPIVLVLPGRNYRARFEYGECRGYRLRGPCRKTAHYLDFLASKD